MAYVPKSERGNNPKNSTKYRKGMRTDWANIAREYKHYPSSMGKGHRALCEAITYADLGYLERLRIAFPELVEELKGD